MAHSNDTGDRIITGKELAENASAGAVLGRINGPDRSQIERQARFHALQLANVHGESAEAVVKRAAAYAAFLATEEPAK